MIYSQYIMNLYEIGKYEEGRFKDGDLQSKFTLCKETWIRKMVNNTNFHPRLAVANITLKDFGGANILIPYEFITFTQNADLFTEHTFIL